MELNMKVKGRGTLVIAMNGLEKRLKGTIMVGATKDLVQVDLEDSQDTSSALEGGGSLEPVTAKSVSVSLHNCIIYWDQLS
jgi:hypothetical protein